MSYSCKIIADSISPEGARLTTMEIVFPRFILAEFNTHRMFSRNSASSRAIPTEKLIERVLTNPYIPETWGGNQKGMQAGEEIDETQASLCREHWLRARDAAVVATGYFNHAKVHKQWANRLLEPYLWHTVIVSATQWSNFFAQRCDPAAQPEMQTIANLMRDTYDASLPKLTRYHLPYLQEDEKETIFGFSGYIGAAQVCVARCARVSYLTHDGVRSVDEDIALYKRLEKSGHWSPFEHVAKAAGAAIERSGNFVGWRQWRKQFTGECR